MNRLSRWARPLLLGLAVLVVPAGMANAAWGYRRGGYHHGYRHYGYRPAYRSYGYGYRPFVARPYVYPYAYPTYPYATGYGVYGAAPFGVYGSGIGVGGCYR